MSPSHMDQKYEYLPKSARSCSSRENNLENSQEIFNGNRTKGAVDDIWVRKTDLAASANNLGKGQQNNDAKNQMLPPFWRKSERGFIEKKKAESFQESVQKSLDEFSQNLLDSDLSPMKVKRQPYLEIDIEDVNDEEFNESKMREKETNQTPEKDMLLMGNDANPMLDSLEEEKKSKDTWPLENAKALGESFEGKKESNEERGSHQEANEHLEGKPVESDEPQRKETRKEEKQKEEEEEVRKSFEINCLEADEQEDIVEESDQKPMGEKEKDKRADLEAEIEETKKEKLQEETPVLLEDKEEKIKEFPVISEAEDEEHTINTDRLQDDAIADSQTKEAAEIQLSCILGESSKRKSVGSQRKSVGSQRKSVGSKGNNSAGSQRKSDGDSSESSHSCEESKETGEIPKKIANRPGFALNLKFLKEKESSYANPPNSRSNSISKPPTSRNLDIQKDLFECYSNFSCEENLEEIMETERSKPIKENKAIKTQPGNPKPQLNSQRKLPKTKQFNYSLTMGPGASGVFVIQDQGTQTGESLQNSFVFKKEKNMTGTVCNCRIF